MSMPIITLTSASNTGISHASASVNGKTFRDPSFSSYLNGAEETFVLQLRGTGTRGLKSCISFPHDRIFLGKNETKDTEIDVFDAKNYFNEGFNQSPEPDIATKILPSHQLRKDDPDDVFEMKGQPRIATPSMHSESSWNSRRAILHTVPKNQQPRKTTKKSFLASIGCNCSCRDKNSVNIDDLKGENCPSKSTNTGLVNGKSKQGDKCSDHLVNISPLAFNSIKYDEVRVNMDSHFSFPVFNPKTGNQAAKVQLQEEDDATKRKSLEIFGGKNCLSVEKKLTMLTWDAIAPEAKVPSISSEIHNDGDSDASSDLFEIESLSKGSMSGCITPTSCYAPSEASIEWSVITASAADFSVLSDSEEFRSNTNATMPHLQKVGLNSKVGAFKKMPKQPSGILSDCKSQKAVRVAGDAHRAYDKGFSNPRRPLRSESFTPLTRFHDNSTLACFDARTGSQFDACVPSQSQHRSVAHL